MIDPLTAFGILKAGLSAGKQLTSLTKDIASFFDSIDASKAKHKKKKSSMFSSSNEEALDTFMKQQQAIDCEEELRILITSSRGISQWRNLQNLRREIRVERKEQARLDSIAREEKQQMIISGLVILAFIVSVLGSGGAYLWHLGYLKF
jgi:hypothetical protein